MHATLTRPTTSTSMTASPPWPHLRVVSRASLQYGTASPQQIAERAAADGHRRIALTDRDGIYGAVQWAQACQANGLGMIIGVDLATDEVIASSSRAGDVSRRTPARGGHWLDEHRPRVVLLAHGPRGWASLCRVVSAAHGDHVERGKPWLRLSDLAEYSSGLIALLGSDSEVGQHLAARRMRAAEKALQRWQSVMGSGLRIAVGSHRTEPSHHASTANAAYAWEWARSHRVSVVLASAARYLEPSDARVADVLDAARHLVPVTSPHVERNNGEANLKSPNSLSVLAEDIATAASESADELLHATEEVAEQCVIDPASGMGIGSVFVPELDVLLGRPGSTKAEEATREAHALLNHRCREAIDRRYPSTRRSVIERRLAEELETIAGLGFAGYFLTVAEVVTMIKDEGIRVAARGSGAGSLVNYLLGISGVDPIRHGLLMERFLSPLRRALPDIDIDVESARRLNVYDLVYERFGSQRVACVSMMETYRVRHAVRDVGAALGFPPAETDAFAKAFPHVRARDARAALQDLPELRSSGFGRMAAEGRLDGFLDLVEALDGLPRHIAMHPCGVLLSDASLLDRTPVERSAAGYPMSQFDKDDVETMGLLKLDVLGVRMQSSIAHALGEIQRATAVSVDLDVIPLDDPETFSLIRSTRTLGCFQIESPGQRELIGKFAPETFGDIIVDISLFRPGPVKSDMVTPFLKARQGWAQPQYLHPNLRPILEETCGVVVFHEQVLRIVALMTGCSLAEADETRRAMSSAEGMDDVRAWFYPAAIRCGYSLDVVERVWDVLRSFASFGFCKAHAAAFALPTYQSAWLKAHYPAAFYAGILTHDPGMYPRRLILDDARLSGVTVLGLDINRSTDAYRIEGDRPPGAIRLPLTQVKGIASEEVVSIMAGQPYSSLSDVWQRARLSRPTTEALVISGAFDGLYGFDLRGVDGNGCGARQSIGRRGRLTRRDLLLQAAELDRRSGMDQSCTAQLSLDLGDDPGQAPPSGLPEMSASERVRAEIDVLGLDVSTHVISFYGQMLDQLGVIRSNRLLECRSQQEVLVAGVKVATQTPPIRSGRRVVFVTLDDSTGPIDATFFEDAQQSYAGTVFQGWLLLIRGEVRRTGPRGVSIRATGCWDLGSIREHWAEQGVNAVLAMIDSDRQQDSPLIDGSGRRRVLVHPSGFRQSPYADVRPAGSALAAAGRSSRSPGAPAKLWHSSPGSSGW